MQKHIRDILPTEQAQTVINLITAQLPVDESQVMFHESDLFSGVTHYATFTMKEDIAQEREYLLIQAEQGEPYALAYRDVKNGYVVTKTVSCVYFFDGQVDDHDQFLILVNAIPPLKQSGLH